MPYLIIHSILVTSTIYFVPSAKGVDYFIPYQTTEQVPVSPHFITTSASIIIDRDMQSSCRYNADNNFFDNFNNGDLYGSSYYY